LSAVEKGLMFVNFYLYLQNDHALEEKLTFEY